MSDNIYRFPAMANLNEFTMRQQFEHIVQEVKEAAHAWNDLKHDRDNSIISDHDQFGMELLDVIHATETALRMEFNDEKVKQLRDAVEKKNRERGYYE